MIEGVTEGMTEVSQETFFAALYADKRDIMPIIKFPYPYTSYWKTRDGQLFGVSKEGNYFLSQ